jgi:hypothetical protein
MAFRKESLKVIQERTFSNYISLFKPIEKQTRYNLLQVLANVDAGLFYLLQGDLIFLSKQIFPDTAESEYLRAHWSSRVPPLYAVAAIGKIEVSGIAGVSVPAGTIFQGPSGKRYFIKKAYIIGSDGKVIVDVTAEEAGSESNLPENSPVKIVSTIFSGIDTNAVVIPPGITGGVEAESDELYLSRVINFLRNPVRYGKPKDFAAWAEDASSAVSKAWEFHNFGIFGALLIQVVGGNQTEGIVQVGNLDIIRDYINTVAPPVLFTVRTPDLIPLNPVISLLPSENSVNNREIVENRLKDYLELTAKPGIRYTAGILRDAMVDGVQISGGTVSIGGSVSGDLETTILELPVLGEITWQ